MFHWRQVLIVEGVEHSAAIIIRSIEMSLLRVVIKMYVGKLSEVSQVSNDKR